MPRKMLIMDGMKTACIDEDGTQTSEAGQARGVEV